MKKKIITILVGLALLFTIRVNAADIKDNQQVDKNKSWKIVFNSDISFDHQVKDGIYVTDSKGNKIKTNLYYGDDSKSIIVGSPVGGYNPGESYKLNIENTVHSKENKQLQRSINMNFIVKTDSSTLSTKETMARNGDAIVYIEVMDSKKNKIASGSGFIIEATGEVVTNFHVIEGASYAKVSLQDKRSFDANIVLSYSKERDLAVLKLSGASDLKTVKLGESDGLAVGENVVAIGSPLGFQNTVSTGIISAIRDTDRTVIGAKDLQITAPISHGSSGGALFDEYGRVVGVTYAGVAEGENLNFAIPINEVKNLIKNKEPKNLMEANGIAAPVVPSGVNAWALDSSSIAIQWDDADSMDGYYVYYSTNRIEWSCFEDEDGEKKLLQKREGYSAVLEELYPEEKVYFKVTSLTNGVESAESSIVYAITNSSSDSSGEDITVNSYYPKLSTVPMPEGYKYDITKDEEDISSYLYDTNTNPRSFIDDFQRLLKQEGWEYYKTEKQNAGGNIVYYTKDSNVVSVAKTGHYFVVMGNMH